jgi:hypothetical protein
MPKLSQLPTPAKALVTAVILTMAIALMGALGQVVVHDIIPTFFEKSESGENTDHQMKAVHVPESEEEMLERGDLFSAESVEERTTQPLYKTEEFVWTLRWTHIHLFGMNMIFIFMGAIAVFLDLKVRTRT